MNSYHKYLSAGVLALLCQAAFAQSAPPLGSASGFTLLSFGTSAPALTVTGTAGTVSTISGNVGSAGAVTLTDARIAGNLNHGGALTCTPAGTPCPAVSGTTTASLNPQVSTDFNAAYAALAALACDQTLTGTLAGRTLTPGVYCFAAGLTMTNMAVTLAGGPTSKWIFKIGTGGTGALTFTDSSVVMGSPACNVTWWSKEGTTITRGAFKGTVLAGTGFTTTGTGPTPQTFAGQALAKTGVTATDMNVTGCP